jgi:capsular polysaccharide biosynthesis protein
VNAVTLSEIIRTIARGGRTLLAALVLALVLAGVYAAFSPASYQATSVLYVEPKLPDDATKPALQQATAYANYQTITFKRLATTDAILDPVVADLDLDVTSRELATSVTALSALDTAIIEVIVDWDEPESAALIANAIADQMSDSLSEERYDTDVIIDVRVVQEAVAPSGQLSPSLPLVIGFGTLAALLLGLGVVFLREWLTPKVYGVEQLERIAQVPTIGIVTRKRPADGISQAAQTLRAMSPSERPDLIMTVGRGVDSSAASELAEASEIPAMHVDLAAREITEEVRHARAVVLVASRGHTSVADVLTALDTLQTADTLVAGWVLVEVPTRGVDAFAPRRPH